VRIQNDAPLHASETRLVESGLRVAHPTTAALVSNFEQTCARESLHT